jgi:hypothetical protein
MAFWVALHLLANISPGRTRSVALALADPEHRRGSLCRPLLSDRQCPSRYCALAGIRRPIDTNTSVEIIVGRSSAIANLLFLVAPILIGAPIMLMLPVVSGMPRLWAYVAVVAYCSGLALFLTAKISLLKTGHFLSWGSKSMTTPYRILYRVGYTLLAFALVIYVNLTFLGHIR